MARFDFGLSSAVGCFWRVLSCLLLWTTTLVRALGGYFPPALRWRNDNRSTSAGAERSETSCPVWWFWRVLYFLRFWLSKFVRALSKHIPPALHWRKDDRSNTAEPEMSHKLMSERGNGENSEGFLQESPQVSEDKTDQEGQHDAEGETTSAGLVRQLDKEKHGWSQGEGIGFDRQESYRVETTDEFYCDYDSTWETEECENDPPKFTQRPQAPKSYKFRRFENAAKDMHNYRHNYPNQKWSQSWNSPVTDTQPNLNFYLGKIPSLPDAVRISDFHNDWYGSYDKLEDVHTFIQWLFPLPEPGVNYKATPLTSQEIKDFCNSATAQANLLKSYKLMLDFYGIYLRDETTGEVKRAPNWRDRFRNLNCHTHNNLRITRILKCLGILGFPHYQAPLVHFFLNETLVHGELQNVRESALNYFLFAVLDKEKRRDLIKFAFKNYKHDEFVWCPKSIQEIWSHQSESEPQRGINGGYQSEQ